MEIVEQMLGYWGVSAVHGRDKYMKIEQHIAAYIIDQLTSSHFLF
jgi:hypothetical protein